MKVKVDRLCIVLLLIIAVVLILAPTIADAQISPTPITKKPIITYTPPDEIKWICTDSQGDEIVVPKTISPNLWTFDITPDPSRLTVNEIKDYPYEVFHLIYPGTDPGVRPVKVPVDPRLYTVRELPISDATFGEILYSSKINLDKNSGLSIIANKGVLTDAYIKYGVHSATYAAVSSTITWESGDSTQYFQDIYEADVANGWGVVTSCGTGCYCLNAFLKHQSGIVSDNATTARFKDGVRTANAQDLIVVSGGTVTLGLIVNEDVKSTKSGCTIIPDESGYWGDLCDISGDGDINLYSCNVTTSKNESLNVKASRIWNTILGYGIAIQDDMDVFNTTIIGTYSAITNSSADRLVLLSNSYQLRFQGNVDKTLLNIYSRDAIAKTFYMNNPTGVVHAIDCDIDTWNFNWGTTTTLVLYRQNTFDCTVSTSTGTPIQNANVQIWDLSGVPIANLSTSISGTVTSQLLNYGAYSRLNGDNPVMDTPHRLRITMDGYYPYEDVFLMDIAKDFHIALIEIPEDTTATTLQAWMQSNIIDWLEVDFMETITGLFFVMVIVYLAFHYGGWMLCLFASMVCFGFGAYYYDNELFIYSIPLVSLGLLILGQEIKLSLSQRKHR